MKSNLKEAIKWLGAIALLVVSFRLIGLFVELHYTGTYKPLW